METFHNCALRIEATKWATNELEISLIDVKT